MRVLLLIPHRLKADRDEAVRQGLCPQADYDALADRIRKIPGGEADILDWNAVDEARHPLVRLARRVFGHDVALALLGYRARARYDAVLTQSEATGLPLALMLWALRRRPRHVTTAYYLVGRRNFIWHRLLRIHRGLDKIFVLSRDQHDVGRRRLKIPAEKLCHLEAVGYIDSEFFAPSDQAVAARQICSVGLEFRDYPTLLEAVAGLPDVTLKIDANSPWSRHRCDLGRLELPANVELCRLPLGGVRQLYAQSAAIVIPLRRNTIGAGSTTLFEVMTMGKPAIITRSPDNSYGGRQGIADRDNVLMVEPKSVADLRRAISEAVGDEGLRRRLGANARNWARQHISREQWLGIVIEALAPGLGEATNGSAPRRSGASRFAGEPLRDLAATTRMT